MFYQYVPRPTLELTRSLNLAMWECSMFENRIEQEEPIP